MAAITFLIGYLFMFLRYSMWSDLRDRMDILELRIKELEETEALLLDYVSDEIKDRITSLKKN